MMATEPPTPDVPRPGSAREVFGTFLRLGLTSFGGPIAHIGHLRRECVSRRGWLDEARFGQLVALCQFLPGPASSQLGFALGLVRAGWRGAVAAFVGFTLPSALAMWAFAIMLPGFADSPALRAAIQGLKLLAVAVVAHGLAGMARRLAPDPARMAIAAASGLLVLLAPGHAWLQLAVIAMGACTGLALSRVDGTHTGDALSLPHGSRGALALLGVWAVLLCLALAQPPVPSPDPGATFSAFFRTGTLVFGGGHVVLPLLHEAVVEPGWVDGDTFLAGYGAAQVVPGPMFTLAAFLGASLSGGPSSGLLAVIALLAIFLPGLLLVAALLPLQARLARSPPVARAMAGVNAAVVGLLAAAFYDPVWREGIRNASDLLVALVALGLLASGRVPVLLIVFWCVAAALAMSRLA
jgi:chromate transporter